MPALALRDTIRSNHPWDWIFSHRESGYADVVLEHLQALLGPGWDLYLCFELTDWKGNDLVIEPSPNKKAVLCICDESNRTAYPFLDQVDVVFRTYLPENQRGKIYHAPVGPSRAFAPGPVLPVLERPYNLFFSGDLHRGRAGLYRAFTGLPAMPFPLLYRLRRFAGQQFDNIVPESIVRFSTGFHSGLAPEDYSRLLGQSKIIPCPAGSDCLESMRHFEAASQGCIVISEALPDAEVYRNAPFVFVTSLSTLRAEVARLLADPARMVDLQQQTLAWWEHTAGPVATAARLARIAQTYA